MTKKKSTNDNANEIVNAIIAGYAGEKGQKDCFNLPQTNFKFHLADYFVICSGTSDKQVDAISESIEKFTFLNEKEEPWRTEGKNNFEWVILDYINVVAHVFTEKMRDFSVLLKVLWGDAKSQFSKMRAEVKEIK